MEAQDTEGTSGTTSTSFEQSLERLEADKFTEWPNFTVEEDYRDQHDRHSIRSLGALSTAEVFFPRRTSGRQTNPVLRIKRMCTRFPVRDMSWIVGISFTIGSAVFVANGFFLLLPLVDPSTDFGVETPYLTPASSILGTLIFLGGSWAAVLEALNLKRGLNVTHGIEVEMNASTEIRNAIKNDIEVEEPKSPVHRHSHVREPTPSNPPVPSENHSDNHSTQQPESVPSDTASNHEPEPTLALIGSPTFIYLPSALQFRQTYAHSLVFHSSVTQLLGAIIFTWATITSIPGVIDFSNFTLVSVTNYLPASLGGLLFLIAAILQILNAKSWRGIDWHIGFWNGIGSAGFMLAGALPWIGTEAGDFQATLADFWGSWAFLVGSVLQWYCAMGSYV